AFTPESRSPMEPEIVSTIALPSAGQSSGLLEAIVIAGGVRSIIQVNVAGVGSAPPVLPTARTANVWFPSERPLKLAGLVHALNGALSSEHSKLAIAETGWLPLNENCADLLVVGVAGELSIVVSGGSLSAITTVAVAALPTS